MSGCCAPERGGGTPPRPRRTAPTSKRREPIDSLVELPGGTFAMGSEDADINPEDGEAPVRQVTVAPFLIDRTAVSNLRFREFVEATGRLTDAERYGWSFVFSGFLPSELAARLPSAPAAPWWRAVRGADWLHPEGPGSGLGDREDHPVVHVSCADATAFCDWAGCRLPSEREWELAARGGLEGKRYPWGDELRADGRWRCNVWQGVFPDRDDAEDGYAGTAPVDAFEPNGYGLLNMVGNAWEWTRTGYRTPAVAPGTMRAIRGGSYLCHASYSNRYRVSARTGITPESSTGNLGFRCAR